MTTRRPAPERWAMSVAVHLASWASQQELRRQYAAGLEDDLEEWRRESDRLAAKIRDARTELERLDSLHIGEPDG